jgi:hypothetical protein
VQPPPDIDGELLRLWSRQDHAMTQCVEEAGIADPALLLNQVVVHDGDVGRRAAEADPSQLEPEPQRLLERRLLHHTGMVHPADSGARESG